MATPGPALPPAAATAKRGGPTSLSERLQALQDSWKAIKPHIERRLLQAPPRRKK